MPGCRPLLPALAVLVFAFLAAGCQTTAPTRSATLPEEADSEETDSWSASEESAADASAETAASPAPETARGDSGPRDGQTVIETGQYRVTKEVVSGGPVGKELVYRVILEARDKLLDVRLTERFPEGIAFAGAEPSAQLRDGNPTWTFSTMDAGTSRTFTVRAEPTRKGERRIDSVVRVSTEGGLTVSSGQPRLEVVKEGPSTIELGEEASWSVEVTNRGNAGATNVVVRDELPDAFEPTSPMRRDLGELVPGETRSLTFSAKAREKGEFRNLASATYDGAPEGEAALAEGGEPIHESGSPLRVVESGIRVRKDGPEEAYVFKPEKFSISVENTGDTKLRNVRITDVLPEGASVADNANGRVTGNAIGWMIPSLPAGGRQRITTEISGTRTGESTNTVRVVTADGLQASDSVTTEWLAVPGVTISITDSKDPIRVRESTTYSLRVRNQGDFEPVSGTIKVTFNEKLKPVSVSGSEEGKIDGRTVTFPRTTLKPGKDIKLSITAEGASVGSGRAIMRFTSDFLAEAIISQEATNVY